MLQDSIQKYISGLLLTLSDLCNTDSEVAACLTLLQIPTPTGVKDWDAKLVRDAMPAAYSTVSSISEYASNPNPKTLDYCRAIFETIKRNEEQNEK